MKIKRLVAVLIAAVTVFTLTATPKEAYADEEKEPLEVAYILSQAASTPEANTYGFFKDALAEAGYDWSITEMDCQGDAQNVAKSIQDAVAKEVDAIVIGYADLRACKAALASAVDADIPVFTIDSGWTEGVVVDITSNQYASSAKSASYMINKLGGKGKIVVLKMELVQACRRRYDVLMAELKESPEIEILDEHAVDMGSFIEDTKKTIEDYINKYGDEIDCVWCAFDDAALVCSNSLKAKGYTRDDVFVMGFDASPEVVEAMRAGDPMLVSPAQGYQGYGKKVVELVQGVVGEGKPITDFTTSNTIYLETPLITADNLPEGDTPPYLSPDYNTKLVMNEG